MDPHAHCECRAAILANRRSVIAGLACTAALTAASPFLATVATAQFADDERFMRMALEEARQGDFPFGAVIVRDGNVLARGRNLGGVKSDPTAHGEMVAIRRFLAANTAAALRGTTLYTTGEPCAMCMGAILWSGITRLVFAASVTQLATRIDQIMISSRDIAATAKFAPIEIIGGVLADEAMALFAK